VNVREGKRKKKPRLEGNIKMDVKINRYGGVDWIHLAQDIVHYSHSTI
jgi:hypothetical protein